MYIYIYICIHIYIYIYIDIGATPPRTPRRLNGYLAQPVPSLSLLNWRSRLIKYSVLHLSPAAKAAGPATTAKSSPGAQGRGVL